MDKSINQKVRSKVRIKKIDILNHYNLINLYTCILGQERIRMLPQGSEGTDNKGRFTLNVF